MRRILRVSSNEGDLVREVTYELAFSSFLVSTRAEQSKFLQLDRLYLLRTTGQAAPLLGTSSSSLLRWIHDGKVPAVRIGKLHYVIEEFPSSGRM